LNLVISGHGCKDSSWCISRNPILLCESEGASTVYEWGDILQSISYHHVSKKLSILGDTLH